MQFHPLISHLAVDAKIQTSLIVSSLTLCIPVTPLELSHFVFMVSQGELDWPGNQFTMHEELRFKLFEYTVSFFLCSELWPLILSRQKFNSTVITKHLLLGIGFDAREQVGQFSRWKLDNCFIWRKDRYLRYFNSHCHRYFLIFIRK